VAFRQHADLHCAFPRFEFVVADKARSGRGVELRRHGGDLSRRALLDLDDAALAFVLAREMSHIIAGHHDENVTTSILVGVAAQILFPVLNLPALISGSAATTAAATSARHNHGDDDGGGLGGIVCRFACVARQLPAAAGDRGRRHGHGTAGGRRLGWPRGGDQLQAMPPPLPDGAGLDRGTARVDARRIASLMQGPPSST
jgi:hypothetical protein